MEEIKLWRVGLGVHGRPTIEPVRTVSSTSTEQLLEDILTGSPEVLEPGLRLIGRQTEAAGGWLDLLGVDTDGNLVVFELKRGRLTRDAIAQVIDYASFLDSLEPTELSAHISERSGAGGTQKIDNFAEWYFSEFERRLDEVGRPRMVLVGLGVDDTAKRMATFLAKADLDVSLVTFHGFDHDGTTYLARQVEVKAPTSVSGVSYSKSANQARLDERLNVIGITEFYKNTASKLAQHLGSSAYQWPNAGGYTYSLPELSETGRTANRAYVSLYVPSDKAAQVQLFLQERAVEAIGKTQLQQMAEAFAEPVSFNGANQAEIWLNPAKGAASYDDGLRTLGTAVRAGWQQRREQAAKQQTDRPPD